MEITQTKVTTIVEAPDRLIAKHEAMLAAMSPLERELYDRAVRAIDEHFFYGDGPRL